MSQTQNKKMSRKERRRQLLKAGLDLSVLDDSSTFSNFNLASPSTSIVDDVDLTVNTTVALANVIDRFTRTSNEVDNQGTFSNLTGTSASIIDDVDLTVNTTAALANVIDRFAGTSNATDNISEVIKVTDDIVDVANNTVETVDLTRKILNSDIDDVKTNILDDELKTQTLRRAKLVLSALSDDPSLPLYSDLEGLSNNVQELSSNVNNIDDGYIPFEDTRNIISKVSPIAKGISRLANFVERKGINLGPLNEIATGSSAILENINKYTKVDGRKPFSMVMRDLETGNFYDPISRTIYNDEEGVFMDPITGLAIDLNGEDPILFDLKTGMTKEYMEEHDIPIPEANLWTPLSLRESLAKHNEIVIQEEDDDEDEDGKGAYNGKENGKEEEEMFSDIVLRDFSNVNTDSFDPTIKKMALEEGTKMFVELEKMLENSKSKTDKWGTVFTIFGHLVTFIIILSSAISGIQEQQEEEGNKIILYASGIVFVLEAARGGIGLSKKPEKYQLAHAKIDEMLDNVKQAKFYIKDGHEMITYVNMVKSQHRKLNIGLLKDHSE